jgi:hypothetical protein
VELLVLGPFEVLGTELHQEGAHMEPLLHGDPMEPADPNRDHSSMKLADLIRRDEISQVRISVAGGVGAEEGAHRSMMMLPLELAKSTPGSSSRGLSVVDLLLSVCVGGAGGGRSKEMAYILWHQYARKNINFT